MLSMVLVRHIPFWRFPFIVFAIKYIKKKIDRIEFDLKTIRII